MKNIQLIIWDMDGVKYPITDNFQNTYTAAIAKAAGKILSMDFEEALALAQQSKKEFDKSRKIFVDRYGLDAEALTSAAESEIDIGCLSADPLLPEKISQTGTDHIILTDASPMWVERVLKQLRLSDFYADKHCITVEDFAGTNKKTSRYPFEVALQKAGHLAENALMVEDRDYNLKHPKEMGMTTVLIDPKGAKKPQDHIDYIFHSAITFLDAFIAQRRPS